MRRKFDVNTAAYVAYIYIWISPKKEVRYSIAVLNREFGKKACFHFSRFFGQKILNREIYSHANGKWQTSTDSS